MRMLRMASVLCAGMTEQVARASPDGYTLVVSSLGSFIISPVFTPVPFDPFRDFTHMAYLGGQPVALFANKDLPLRTLSDLVAYAKSRPGAVTYATISIGSQTQLLNEQFQARAGIKMTHVPYRRADRQFAAVTASARWRDKTLNSPVGMTARVSLSPSS